MALGNKKNNHVDPTPLTESTERVTVWHKINRRITGIFLWLAAGALMVMMLIAVANITGRSFDLPILGANEIVSLSGVILISFVIGFVQCERRNVITSILVDRLSPRIRAIFDSVTLFLALVVVAVMAWAAISFGLEEIISFRRVTITLGIEEGPFKAIWGFGCIILFLVILGHFVEALLRSIKR